MEKAGRTSVAKELHKIPINEQQPYLLLSMKIYGIK